jgi:hypothetical protein
MSARVARARRAHIGCLAPYFSAWNCSESAWNCSEPRFTHCICTRRWYGEPGSSSFAIIELRLSRSHVPIHRSHSISRFSALSAWFALGALACSCGSDHFVAASGGSAGQSGANSAGNGGSGQSGGSRSFAGNSDGDAGEGGSAGEIDQGGSGGAIGGSAGRAGNGGSGLGGGAGHGAAAGRGGTGQGGSAGRGGTGSGGNAGRGGSSGSGGSAGQTGTPCRYGSDATACVPGEYCNAPGCGVGTCTKLSKIEAPDRKPVCGCDGVTYWNASIAVEAGASVKISGECVGGKSCGGFASQPCPASATCNYRLTGKDQCGAADFPGTCWALPSTCPAVIGFGPSSRACASLSCTDECTLIRLQTLWYADAGCPL